MPDDSNLAWIKLPSDVQVGCTIRAFDAIDVCISDPKLLADGNFRAALKALAPNVGVIQVIADSSTFKDGEIISNIGKAKGVTIVPVGQDVFEQTAGMREQKPLFWRSGS